MFKSQRDQAISRLWTRFLLSQLPQQDNTFYLAPVIQPVTQADELLKTSKSVTGTFDISAAASEKVLWTVPDGKRWRLKVAGREATTAATQIRVLLNVRGGNTSSGIIAPNVTTDTRTICDIVMNEKDQIIALTTGNGADNARYFSIIYEEEDAF